MFSSAWTPSISAELVKAAATAVCSLLRLYSKGRTHPRVTHGGIHRLKVPDHLGELITDRAKSYREVYLWKNEKGKGVFLSTLLLLITPRAPLLEKRLIFLIREYSRNNTKA